jgi:hypothetical protein
VELRADAPEDDHLDPVSGEYVEELLLVLGEGLR